MRRRWRGERMEPWIASVSTSFRSIGNGSALNSGICRNPSTEGSRRLLSAQRSGGRELDLRPGLLRRGPGFDRRRVPLPESSGKRLQGFTGARIGQGRVKNNFRRRKRRQVEALAHFNSICGREATGERGNGQSRGDCRINGSRDADENLDPRNTNAIKCAGGDITNTTERRKTRRRRAQNH